MNSRRLTTVFAATIVAGLALSGCSADAGGGSAKETSGSALERVTEAGTLVVGTEGTYRPFSFHEGGAGDLTGYDVEVVTAVADQLGLDVEFEETQWDGIFAGLEAERFDIIANQVSISPDREEQYTLTDPYTVSPGVLIVSEDNTDITSLEDLAGKTTAQSLTSNWYKVAEEAGATVEGVEGWAQAIELLEQGRIDATVNDKLTYLDYLKGKPDAPIKVVAETEDPSLSAFALKSGSDDLAEAINEALAELAADGTLAEISVKYFGEDVSK
ncbi:amino acid ABC transporter substrate-binding protein [Mycetocola zhujimingii]|uniref:Polar amino acid ABC transporter substrate-binding protein n=1 Tax=Mycetocola zhujimingii TaxID=2079792 RepID=A0A2U1TBB6_9MICO|nr:amino acid ABC transporter substrate-binding protein [Mycetocola zhujimingii]AWB87223.1 polar amino acid ABC transporter substrate-binding protein [Mycetocola zhujimingii]PWC06100.1 polar amino acid ABC transporter substrate-binding protein [Mycetocola zhujimingii]